jgi:hypothetical protein
VGAVAKSSTLRRFITAKDDNEKKTLCWGIITDANRAMVITLRDFRPHVGELINAGYKDLAGWILTDYLEAYARGMNQYISDLQHITQASRETRFLKGSLDGE